MTVVSCGEVLDTRRQSRLGPHAWATLRHAMQMAKPCYAMLWASAWQAGLQACGEEGGAACARSTFKTDLQARDKEGRERHVEQDALVQRLAHHQACVGKRERETAGGQGTQGVVGPPSAYASASKRLPACLPNPRSPRNSSSCRPCSSRSALGRGYSAPSELVEKRP